MQAQLIRRQTLGSVLLGFIAAGMLLVGGVGGYAVRAITVTTASNPPAAASAATTSISGPSADNPTKSRHFGPQP